MKFLVVTKLIERRLHLESENVISAGRKNNTFLLVCYEKVKLFGCEKKE